MCNYDIVVCNSTCLIALSSVNKLDILCKVFKKIYISDVVYEEINRKNPIKKDWFIIRSPKNMANVTKFEQEIDNGEASTIQLAIEIEGIEKVKIPILTDDTKAKNFAKLQKIDTIRTGKILIMAKESGVIPNVRDILLDFLRQKNFLSIATCNQILKIAQEEAIS